MTPLFEAVHQILKQLPGIGYRSAERIALSLLVERPERIGPLIAALSKAQEQITRCTQCGNISEGQLCRICADSTRQSHIVCVVERIPDLHAIERSGAYRGVYHVLHGKLSPIQNIGPSQLNLASFQNRLSEQAVTEVILALSNDIEGEATCHYIQQNLPTPCPTITRIGFGLPTGSTLMYADPTTLKSALDGRRQYE